MQEEQLGLILKRISNAIKKSVDRDMRDIDITMAQGMVLGFVALHEPGSLSQRDIEHRFGLRHPTVSGILKRLEQNGFVTFEVNADDKRVKNIFTTDKAAQLESRVKKNQKQIEERLTRGLSADELETLRSLLGRVLENVSEKQQVSEEDKW